MSEHKRGEYRRIWIDHTSEVEASVGDVAALLQDVDGWADWTPGLTEVRRNTSEPVRPGSKFTMMLKPAPFHPPLPVPCVMFKVEHNYIEWGGGFAGSKVRHSFSLTPVGDGRTSVRQLEYATNLLALVARIAEPGIYKHDLRWQNALADKLARR